MCFEQHVHVKARLCYTFHYFLSHFFGCTIWHSRSQFPNQGWNLCPLYGKHGVSTTGPPGKSLLSLLTLLDKEKFLRVPGWRERDVSLLLFHPNPELSLSAGPAQCGETLLLDSSTWGHQALISAPSTPEGCQNPKFKFAQNRKCTQGKSNFKVLSGSLSLSLVLFSMLSVFLTYLSCVSIK